MQQIIISGIIDPTFNGYGVVWGMLALGQLLVGQHTFMENVADRRVVKDHNLGQIRLDATQIFDV